MNQTLFSVCCHLQEILAMVTSFFFLGGGGGGGGLLNITRFLITVENL